MIDFILFAVTAAVAGTAVAGDIDISPAARLRHEICYALATAPAYPANLTDCLSFSRAPEAAFTAQVCNFLRDTDQLEDFRFANYSACVRDLLAR